MFTSTAGVFSAGPGGVGYTAAKAGVIGLMRWIARDFGPQGIRVNAVAPGWIETPLAGATMGYLAEREGISDEEARRLAVAHVPNRRFGKPSEIASVCAFLASEDASMVNGHVLIADGGAAIVDTTTSALDLPEG
jgi:NAD(P)-dependent dehydrogenase (short-subunit alcohol dehydrogenase family)